MTVGLTNSWKNCMHHFLPLLLEIKNANSSKSSPWSMWQLCKYTISLQPPCLREFSDSSESSLSSISDPIHPLCPATTRPWIEIQYFKTISMKASHSRCQILGLPPGQKLWRSSLKPSYHYSGCFVQLCHLSHALDNIQIQLPSSMNKNLSVIERIPVWHALLTDCQHCLSPASVVLVLLQTTWD